MYTILASAFTLPSPIAITQISPLGAPDTFQTQTVDDEPLIPICFTPETIPWSKPQHPQADDCSEVADLFIQEDTRREYEPCSFGDKNHYNENQVDFLLPMAKKYESCYGGLAIQQTRITEKIWMDLHQAARKIPWLQRYCEPKGNLGGGVANKNGLAFLVYGLQPTTQIPEMNDTSILEALLSSNDTAVLLPNLES